MYPIDSFLIWYFVSVACPMALGIWWAFMTRRTWLRQNLIVAMVLFVAFSVIWLWVALTTNEDVPDPSWTDYIWDVIGFLALVPASFVVSDGDDFLIMKVIIVLGVDSLFWGFISVLIYRTFRWWVQKRQFTAPTTALEPTATTP